MRRGAFSRTQACCLALIASFAVAGCTVGPDYLPEAAPTPTHYKELKDWKVATPSDSLNRGDWWGLYRDPRLALLIKQVEISNQTVAAAAAAYEQARAVIREAQAALLPTLTGGYSFTRTKTGSAAASAQAGGPVGGGAIYTTTYNPQLSAAWDIDVWGKVRRQIESNASAAQATKADLDNAKLSAQATLATAYFNLRAADSLHDLLDRTVKEYKKTLDIVRNQFNAGYGPPGSTCCTSADVATAEAQVFTTEAQEINVGVQRAQFEHAIAMLIGRPPAELTIAPRPLTGTIPKIPVAIPSTLLERRPDIAAAERLVAQANAQIGIARAAYFPNLTLSAAIGFESSSFTHWLSWPSRFFSVGPAAAETIFDAGLRRATVQQYRAQYDETVANYRQTVLTAFQQVEDNLASLRILSVEIQYQDTAVKSAEKSLAIAKDRYSLGIDPYLNVLTAQTALLSNQQTAVNLRTQQMTASGGLIEALGGGWNASQLPSPVQLISKVP